MWNDPFMELSNTIAMPQVMNDVTSGIHLHVYLYIDKNVD